MATPGCRRFDRFLTLSNPAPELRKHWQTHMGYGINYLLHRVSKGLLFAICGIGFWFTVGSTKVGFPRRASSPFSIIWLKVYHRRACWFIYWRGTLTSGHGQKCNFFLLLSSLLPASGVNIHYFSCKLRYTTQKEMRIRARETEHHTHALVSSISPINGSNLH